MATDVATVQVVVAANAMKASARILPGSDVAGLTEPGLLAALTARDIEMTDETRDRVRLLAERIAAGDVPAEDVLLAEGTPPTLGTDGRIEWREDCDPTQRYHDPPATDDGVVDHYARSTIVSVAEDDLVCTVVPPQPGTPGCDVFGQPIEPPKAHRAPITTGEGIQERGENTGRLVATISGRLNLVNHKLWVSPLLTIYRDVDFQVGNIEFDGDVLIRGNVLDLFSVKCTKNLVVQGTIEAANIECGGDLAVSGGVAGKEKAVLGVGGKVAVRFIDNATVTAGGNIIVQKEMVNSHLATEQSVITPGAITACRIEAAGGVEASVIGSKSGIRTELTVGGSRETFREVARADREIVALEDRIQQGHMQVQPLLNRHATLPLIQKNMVTKVLRGIKADMARIEELKAHQAQLQDVIRTHRAAGVKVSRLLHDGTTINIGDCSATLRDALRGPLELVRQTVDGQGRIAARTGDGGSVILESYK